MEKINIKNVDEARQFAGRRVRLFWFDGREYQPRGEGTLRLGRLYRWDLVGVGESGLHSIGRNAVFLSVESDAWIELLEQKAREERETEDARFPLPHGWHWEKGIRGILSWPAAVGPAPAPTDGSTICVHVWECSDSRYPPRVVSRVYKDGAVTCEYRSAPLDVVRAVIARYDAEHDAEHGATNAKQEPYSIDIPAGRWASEVSHSFQDGDVIDLTFASGRVQRVTCYVYRDNGLLIDDGYRRDDGNGYSFVVGNVDGRGVTKVTLVSRGAQ